MRKYGLQLHLKRLGGVCTLYYLIVPSIPLGSLLPNGNGIVAGDPIHTTLAVLSPLGKSARKESDLGRANSETNITSQCGIVRVSCSRLRSLFLFSLA